ncbi:hypothetical protein CHCC20343_4207 [Bacillus licheniformis]|nr:hypothetical protein CHCC20343_4207 [Bacillus licheniformis]
MFSLSSAVRKHRLSQWLKRSVLCCRISCEASPHQANKHDGEKTNVFFI